MKNEAEIKGFIKRISKITGFIADYGAKEEYNHSDMGYLSNLADALNWVLDGSSADELLDDNLIINESYEIELMNIIKNIEERIGKKFDTYE